MVAARPWRRINHDGSAGGSPSVVDPYFRPRALRSGPLDVVALRAGVPDVYRSVEFLRVLLGDEDGKLSSGPGLVWMCSAMRLMTAYSARLGSSGM